MNKCKIIFFFKELEKTKTFLCYKILEIFHDVIIHIHKFGLHFVNM